MGLGDYLLIVGLVTVVIVGVTHIMYEANHGDYK